MSEHALFGLTSDAGLASLSLTQTHAAAAAATPTVSPHSRGHGKQGLNKSVEEEKRRGETLLGTFPS